MAVLAAVKDLHAGFKASRGDGKQAKAKTGKKARTQGGHPGYSGVTASKGKKTRTRSMGVRARARG
jgi:hypothetical protein